MADQKTMPCMSCGLTKAWPDAFPSTLYAECWACSWSKHLRESHPRIVRKARREAEKRARTRIRNEEHALVTEELIRRGFAVDDTQGSGS